MGHIHQGPGEHDLTASAYIIRTDADGTNPRAFVHLHKKLGVYLQAGGHVELKENPWECVDHEVAEETGYDLRQLQVLQPKGAYRQPDDNISVLHPIPAAPNTHLFAQESEHYHTDLGYVFVTDQEPSGTPDDGESVDFELLTRQQLETMTHEEMFENAKGPYLWGMDVVEGKNPHWEAVSVDGFAGRVVVRNATEP